VRARDASAEEVRDPDIVIRDVNLSYGENHVLHDISMDMEDRRVDRPDRALGLRQVDAPALPEPDERPDRRREDHAARSA
jgi:hypothetical protein